MEAIEQVETERSYGICATCIHFEGCAFRIMSGTAIWFCEEFDDYQNPPSKPFPRPPEKRPKVEYHDHLMGLCINCLHAATCVHAQKTGGVWYCELYE